jgi:hypothetical protein
MSSSTSQPKVGESSLTLMQVFDAVEQGKKNNRDLERKSNNNAIKMLLSPRREGIKAGKGAVNRIREAQPNSPRDDGSEMSHGVALFPERDALGDTTAIKGPRSNNPRPAPTEGRATGLGISEARNSLDAGNSSPAKVKKEKSQEDRGAVWHGEKETSIQEVSAHHARL